MSFAHALEERGGWLALKHELTGVERVPGGFELRLTAPDGSATSVRAEMLVNSAGLAAPAVGAMLGYPLDGGDASPAIRQTVNKGRYYDIVTPAKARALRHLVYPVPEHAKGGLGVHVTIDVDGHVHLGPDTEWLDDGAPLDYRTDDLRRAGLPRGGAPLPARSRGGRSRAGTGRLPAEAAAPGRAGRGLPDLARPRLRAPRRDRVPGRDGEPRDRAPGRGSAVVRARSRAAA